MSKQIKECLTCTHTYSGSYESHYKSKNHQTVINKYGIEDNGEYECCRPADFSKKYCNDCDNYYCTTTFLHNNKTEHINNLKLIGQKRLLMNETHLTTLKTGMIY